MKKNKLILKACLGSLLPIFTIPVATSVSGPMINSGYIYFQGRKFNNTEEALKYLVQNNKVKVGNKKVLGDVERSYINMETGQLNKDLLPNYDVSKMNFAYNTAGGGLTQDYNKAKRTYFNKGMILKRYDDGYDNSFLSSRDASNSMRNKTIESKLGFVNVDYVNYDGTSLIKKKLNPFNEDDISNYRKNIQENIFNILADNISDYNNPKLEYKVKVKNNINDNKPTIDLIPFFKNIEIPGWKKVVTNTEPNKFWNWFNNKSIKTVDFNKEDIEPNKLSFDFKTKKYKMGIAVENEKFKGFLKGAGNQTLKLSGNNDEDSHYFEGITNAEKLKFSNSVDFINFINNPTIKIKTKDGADDWSDSKKVPMESSPTITKDQVTSHLTTNIKNNIKNKINDDSLLKKMGNPLFKKEKLRKAFFNIYKKNANKIIEKSKITEQYQITNMPEVTSNFTWNYDGWKATYKYYVQFESIGEIEYKTKTSIAFENLLPEINNEKIINKKDYNSLVKYLLSMSTDNTVKTADTTINENTKNDVWLTISKNGRDLFEVNLVAPNSKNDKKNSGIVTKIRRAEKNQINKQKNVLTSNPNSKVSSTNPQEYFYQILKSLKLSLVSNENSRKKPKPNTEIVTDEATILGRYFGEGGYFEKLKNDPRFKYDADFTGATSKTEEKIRFKDMIKLYINIISDVYYEYKNFPKILKRISKNIIDPKDILIVNDEKGISISDLTLGKYMIKSISDFNAPVSNGTFSTDDLLATSRATWSVVKNNVDFNPTLLIIVYDQNGERVNSDDYDYDDETILEFNSRLISEPRRNFEWIYVDGHHGPVENITTTIQYVTIDDHTLYFKTFRQLKEYMLKYILKHSTRG